LNNEVSLRQAEPRDLATLKRIIDLSFPRFFRFFAAQSVDSEAGKVLIREQNGEVTGFAKLIDFCLADRKYGCILWLAVHPNHRCKGVASALVRAGVEDLKRGGAGAVFASVQRRNKGSLATFAKVGFLRVGFLGLWRLFRWRIFQFYGDIWFAPGETALIHD
jgi:ribosomal protein S18 acetylase RimI-like enzyme